ncbi:anti-sigma factor [Kiloniella sp.]|uniref:anti-sigma factor n=1 Tax=Kiloniella sp. TaxID=1938587 RepID=UPI003B02EC4F
MSDKANIDPGMGSGRDEDDALAAEYVLGVLDRAARSSLALRIENDPAFARLVSDWEARLIDLNEAYEAQTPPASVKVALDKHLFDRPEPENSRSIWNSLAFWRLISAGAVFGLIAIVLISLWTLNQPAGQTLVASLSSDNRTEQFVALYETDTQTLRISTLSADKPTDKDYELWIISGDNPPKSLGLVGGVGDKALRVTASLQAKFVEGVTLAVSLEPEGGSTTGLPTGAVIAVGIVKKI